VNGGLAAPRQLADNRLDPAEHPPLTLGIPMLPRPSLPFGGVLFPQDRPGLMLMAFDARGLGHREHQTVEQHDVGGKGPGRAMVLDRISRPQFVAHRPAPPATKRTVYFYLPRRASVKMRPL